MVLGCTLSNSLYGIRDSLSKTSSVEICITFALTSLAASATFLTPIALTRYASSTLFSHSCTSVIPAQLITTSGRLTCTNCVTSSIFVMSTSSISVGNNWYSTPSSRSSSAVPICPSAPVIHIFFILFLSLLSGFPLRCLNICTHLISADVQTGCLFPVSYASP